MIIFNLDGTLANCEHRRHFVFRHSHPDCTCNNGLNDPICPRTWINEWQPNWPAYYEACEDDTLILPTWLIAEGFFLKNRQYSIWSERCESAREKTEKWLDIYEIDYCDLKMRPIGDTTPEHKLKERWLDEAIAEGKAIDFVFESDPESIAMWRRRGVFVFNCAQGG